MSKIWKRFRPSILSLIIPISCFILFFVYRPSFDWKILFFSLGIFLFAALPCWLFLAHILFPRIVVTIEELENTGAITRLTLWADGRRVYKKNKDIDLPIQFSFQVWRRGKYDLCLDTGSNKPIVKEANTYEHTVCHIRFGDKEDVKKGEAEKIFSWLKDHCKNST